MRCPACGHDGMLFDDHHGMEHNVCEECGTVVECQSFIVDIFEPGSREVIFPYERMKNATTRGLLNPKLKSFSESQDILYELTDKLNLPNAVRELSLHFLRHSKSYAKRPSVGACVYLAMKRHDIPVTIKYLANYLEVSHFLIGKVMKRLVKKIGPSAHGSAFSVERLIPLIFNQAKFGGSDDGKRRLDLVLRKTEQLIQLLQGCQMSFSLQPHFFILAAGYIVWKNSIFHGWRDVKVESERFDDQYEELHKGKETVKRYLREVGIHLPDENIIYRKINLMYSVLKKCTLLIPWISEKSPPKEICIHLDDLLKYRSQLIASGTQDVPKEQIVKIEDHGECPSNFCDQTEPNTKFEDVNIRDSQERLKNANLISSIKEETSVCSLKLEFDADIKYSPLAISNTSSEEKDKKGLVFRKVKYTKIGLVNLYPEFKRRHTCLENRNVKIAMSESEKEYMECLSFP